MAILDSAVAAELFKKSRLELESQPIPPDYQFIPKDVYMINNEGRFVRIGHIIDLIVSQATWSNHNAVRISVSCNQDFVYLMSNEQQNIQESFEQPKIKIENALDTINSRDW